MYVAIKAFVVIYLVVIAAGCNLDKLGCRKEFAANGNSPRFRKDCFNNTAKLFSKRIEACIDICEGTPISAQCEDLCENFKFEGKCEDLTTSTPVTTTRLETTRAVTRSQTTTENSLNLPLPSECTTSAPQQDNSLKICVVIIAVLSCICVGLIIKEIHLHHENKRLRRNCSQDSPAVELGQLGHRSAPKNISSTFTFDSGFAATGSNVVTRTHSQATVHEQGQPFIPVE